MTVLFVMPRFHIEMLVLLKFPLFFGITVFSAYGPQGDFTQMLGQRKHYDLPLTFASVKNDHLGISTTARALTLFRETEACPPWKWD